MKSAIICYDLKNVKPYDNILIKAELAKFSNTAITASADNLLSPFPDWVRMSFPDTTIIASVSSETTAADLMVDILQVIAAAGAEADKVYVAFIDPESDLLWNSEVDRS